LYLRNEDNDAWITLAFFDQTNDEWEVRTGVVQAANGDGLALKTDEGTTRVEIADDGSVTVNTSLDVDNIKIDGNSITSTDTNGDINITPDGSGKVVLDGLNYPTADGTDGQVLTTDGSGNIAFEDAGGAGKVLNVVQTFKSDTFSSGSTSFVDITGLSVSITPSSTSSKILVLVNAKVGGENTLGIGLRLLRDSTVIAAGDSAGNRRPGFAYSRMSSSLAIENEAIIFLDSPSTTSSITYKLQGYTDSGASFPFYINRSGDDNDSTSFTRPSSSITVMEIAG